MGISNRITKLMKERGTNANDLALRAGIPASTIYSLIRRDSNRVDIDSLIKIARTLGVTADYLLETGFEDQEAVYNDHKLNKIMKFYNDMDDIGQNELLDQAEFIQKKHPKTNPQEKAI